MAEPELSQAGTDGGGVTPLNETVPSKLRIMDEVALLYGFAVKAGIPTPYHGGDPMPEFSDYIWCHVNLATEAGRHWVQSHSGLSPQLASAFCDKTEEDGVYPYGTGVLIVVEDRLKDFVHDPLDLGLLHIWIEPRRIITGRWHSLAAPDRLKFRLQVGTAPVSSFGLGIELLNEIVTDLETMGRKVLDTVDGLEDRVLGSQTTGLASEIGTVRRQIVRLRRRIVPLRQIIAKAASEMPTWAKDDEADRISSLQSRTEHVGSEIVEAQEQARILQEENSSRATERTNNIMYILTVFTVIILPLNLITGFFGMNVQGLPGVGVDGGFEAVWWGMVATLVLTIAYFKYKKWF